MPTDATGTPSSPDLIPTYNTGLDAPSGKGLNSIVASLQTILNQIRAGTLPGGKLNAAAALTGLVPVANLGSGSADATKRLAGDGAWKTGYGHLIQTIILGSNGDVVFTSIPQTFAHLRVVIGTVRTIGAVTSENLVMQYNSDTSASYNWAGYQNVNGVGTDPAGIGQTYIQLGLASGGSAGANIWTAGDIDIVNYSAAGQRRSFASRLIEPNGNITTNMGGVWQNAVNGITSIRLTGLATTLAAGTQVSLYGMP